MTFCHTLPLPLKHLSGFGALAVECLPAHGSERWINKGSRSSLLRRVPVFLNQIRPVVKIKNFREGSYSETVILYKWQDEKNSTRTTQHWVRIGKRTVSRMGGLLQTEGVRVPPPKKIG